MYTTSADIISSYVEALRPLIYINDFDFEAVDQIIGKSAAKDTKIYEYNNAGGHVDFKNKNRIADYDIVQFLTNFDTDKANPCYLVLKDVHNNLDSPKVLSLLKSLALKTMYREEFQVTVFIVSTVRNIPYELEKFITIYDIPHPEPTEISAIIKDYGDKLKITIDNAVLDELSISFKGLSEFEIRQILNLAYQESGMIDCNDKELILQEKEQIIKKSGMLEHVKIKDEVGHIGGLNKLIKYVELKAEVFKNLGDAKKFGVDLPKGILIVGMPGCGKSLTAKVIAKVFEVPLLRLDVGKLMGKYVGESEENLRRAINTAEAVSPCVLWIDELEKAFAGIGGVGGGSDVTTRLFGNFLTWLQEKESSVYVVATSNDISKLPPEFLRKGRFDQLFFVNLPSPEERKQIFEIHLKKRNKLTKEIDAIKLINDSEGFSGADIEAVVKEAIEDAFVNKSATINTADLQNIIIKTKSISVTLKEKIKEIVENLKKFDMEDAN